MKMVIFVMIVLSMAPKADAGSITVKLPADMVVEKATAITEKLPKTTVLGVVSEHEITFNDALTAAAYEVQITLKDGTVLQGVDMSWYSRVPDQKNAEELNDDDKLQMTDVLKKVLSFYNINDVICIQGNHNRAVMLVQLVRDKPFHSDKADDEVIWRPELWYFENHHGGWEKVQQTDRVLRRERFVSHKEYHGVVDVLKWVPDLGGLKCTPKTPDVTVTLPANAGVSTSVPRGSLPQPAAPAGTQP